MLAKSSLRGPHAHWLWGIHRLSRPKALDKLCAQHHVPAHTHAKDGKGDVRRGAERRAGFLRGTRGSARHSTRAQHSARLTRATRARAPGERSYIKSNPSCDGQKVAIIEDILFEDVRIESPRWWAIWIGPQQQHEPGQAIGEKCALTFPIDKHCPTQACVSFRNITLRDVLISKPWLSPGVILGNASNPMQGLVFDNVKVRRGLRARARFACIRVYTKRSPRWAARRAEARRSPTPMTRLPQVTDAGKGWPFNGTYLCEGVSSSVATEGTTPVPPCF